MPLPPELYVSLPEDPNPPLAVQAFTFDDRITPHVIDGQQVLWQPAAWHALRALLDKVGAVLSVLGLNLPYASLRGLCQIGLSNSLIRMTWDMGIGRERFKKNPGNQDPVTLAVLDGGNSAGDLNLAHEAVENWIVHHLKPYLDLGKVPMTDGDRQRLQTLNERRQLIDVAPLRIQAWPWAWDTTSGSSRGDGMQYLAVPEVLANYLGGEVIFQGLPPLRRLIAANAMPNGIASLLSDPLVFEGDEFSLLVTLKMVTLPSLHQPLVVLKVSRRRWLKDIAAWTAGVRKVQGTILSVKHPGRAFSFQVVWEKDEYGNWGWWPDRTFDVLANKLELRPRTGRYDAVAILNRQADTATCKVRLVHSNSVALTAHAVDVGVPELDVLEALRGAEEVFKRRTPLRRFTAIEEVETQHKVDEARARMINAPTLLGAAIESLETKQIISYTPDYLSAMDDVQINALIKKHFRIGLEAVARQEKVVHTDDKGDNVDQIPDLETLIQGNADAIRRQFGNERPLLLLFYHSSEQRWLSLLRAVANVLWGAAVDIETVPLPVGVHGPKPPAEAKARIKNEERMKRRIDAWTPVAGKVCAMNRQVLSLVMAPDWFPGGHDDRVNKPATRAALASIGRSCVQFLLPPHIFKAGTVDIKGFLLRAQAALKDLLAAHLGRIDGVAEAVAAHFPDPGRRPEEIIGISVVRRVAGRYMRDNDPTQLAVAYRINVADGRCQMKLGYLDAMGRLARDAWTPFHEALAKVASITPITLGDKPDIKKIRFQEFAHEVITESVRNGRQPVVLVDSTNCSALWEWLRDTDINTHSIWTKTRNGSNLQSLWQGARIIRIRQTFAPGIIIDKAIQLALSSPADTAPKKQKKRDGQVAKILHLPTSGQMLLRVVGDRKGCEVYLSLGGKPLHQHKRGLSCFRPVLVPEKVKDGDGNLVRNMAKDTLLTITSRGPHYQQWPTPNAIDIVVALHQKDDNSDQLAEFVESLRYGFGHYASWTALPAPLFFERVVREYISAFALTEEERVDP